MSPEERRDKPRRRHPQPAPRARPAPSPPGRSPRRPASPRARSSGSWSPRRSSSSRDHAGLRARAGWPSADPGDRPRPAARGPAADAGRDPPAAVPGDLRADEEGRHGPPRRPRARQPRGGGRPGADAGPARGRRRSPTPHGSSVPARDLVHRLRLLTFAGSHPHISDGAILTPEEIVFTLLHGLLRPEERKQRLMLLRLLRTHLAPYKPWLAADRGAAVHRDGRDALPAQPQRRHHRQGRGGRRHRLHPAHRRGHARGLAAPDRLLGGRGRLRARAPRCRSAATCAARSSTGSARSPAARSRSSARPR